MWRYGRASETVHVRVSTVGLFVCCCGEVTILKQRDETIEQLIRVWPVSCWRMEVIDSTPALAKIQNLGTLMYITIKLCFIASHSIKRHIFLLLSSGWACNMPWHWLIGLKISWLIVTLIKISKASFHAWIPPSLWSDDGRLFFMLFWYDLYTIQLVICVVNWNGLWNGFN